MAYKQLYIFVEGTDDQRFVEQIIKPISETYYDHVKLICYAQLNKTVVENMIKTFKKQGGSDYIFLCDLDASARGDKSVCITSKKENIQKKYGNILEFDKIAVAKEEIESWYLAGIAEENLDKFKIKPFSDTENVSKEDFEKMIPKNFASKSEFMVEILKTYSLEKATVFNSSLNYFKRKFLNF